MRAEVDVGPVRERRRAGRKAALRAVPWRPIASWGGGGLAALLLLAGVVFAGSANSIPAGVTIAGVEVSGLSPGDAAAKLEARFAEMSDEPVTFTAGGEEFELTPAELDARVDWAALAGEARAEGDWPMPFRGLKRLWLRVVGTDVEARAEVFEPRLAHELDTIATTVDRPGRDASIVLADLEPSVVAEREGRTLNRREAGDEIVKALAGFDREPVPLPIAVALAEGDARGSRAGRGGGPDGALGARAVRVAERPLDRSSPTRWRRFCGFRPTGGSELEIGGSAANKYFAGLARGVNRKPRNASFSVARRRCLASRVEPSQDGRKLDAAASGEALLAGALSADDRDAELVVVPVAAELTTERAKSMKITRVLASYYDAVLGHVRPDPEPPARDRARSTGRPSARARRSRSTTSSARARSSAVSGRRRRSSHNEYKDDVGGGVSQVATTIFNAAWEAGLKITDRTAHTPLHQPLPARARRDGQLPRRRPEVRERHGQLALRPGRRHGRRDHDPAPRRADEPPRRERGRPAPRGRASPRSSGCPTRRSSSARSSSRTTASRPAR